MTCSARHLALGTATRFLHARGGNVAMIFGITSIPMLMTAGIVVDYGVNSYTRQQAQNAVDATTLSLAKLPPTLTNADLSDRAKRQVTAAMAGSQAAGLIVTTVRTGDDIKVTAAGTTPTTLTRIAGFQSLPLNITSTARRGSGNMEIALVLDNTGSMRGTKIANLKSAATELVDTLFEQADPAKPSSLKMAIVPFSMTVNVGAGNADQKWMDRNGKASYHSQLFSTQTNRFSVFSQLKVAWGGCVESRPAPHDVEDTSASEADPDTLYVPFFAPDESDLDFAGVNSYIEDAGASLTATNRERQALASKYNNPSWSVSPGARASTGYLYGPNAGCELQPITPLTSQKSTLTTAIANMTVVGDTNIPMGLVWGWHALSPTGPLVQGVPYSDKTTRKFVVLMTDGQNQSTRIHSSNGSIYSGISYIWANRIGLSSVTSSTAERGAALDERLALLCTNMKNQGIGIFTIRVEVTTGTSDLLKSCASSPSMFYDVADSSGLTAAFKAIGAQLSELRISR